MTCHVYLWQSMFLRTCYVRMEKKFRCSQWNTQRQGSLDVTILTWFSTSNCPLWGWFPTRDFVSNGRNVQRNLLAHKNVTHQEAPTLKEVQFGPQIMTIWLRFSLNFYTYALSDRLVRWEFQSLQVSQILSHVSGKKFVFLEIKAVACLYVSS